MIQLNEIVDNIKIMMFNFFLLLVYLIFEGEFDERFFN